MVAIGASVAATSRLSRAARLYFSHFVESAVQFARSVGDRVFCDPSAWNLSFIPDRSATISALNDLRSTGLTPLLPHVTWRKSFTWIAMTSCVRRETVFCFGRLVVLSCLNPSADLSSVRYAIEPTPSRHSNNTIDAAKALARIGVLSRNRTNTSMTPRHRSAPVAIRSDRLQHPRSSHPSSRCSWTCLRFCS